MCLSGVTKHWTDVLVKAREHVFEKYKEIGDGGLSLARCFYLMKFYQDTFKQRLNRGV